MKTILVLCNGSMVMYKFRKELLIKLAKQYQVVLCAPNDGCVQELEELELTYVDIPIDRHGINPLVDMRLMRTYRDIMLKWSPVAVLTYTIKPNLYANLIARRKIPVISTVTGMGNTFLRGGAVGKLVVFLYRMAFKYAHRIVFQNDEDRLIMKKLNIPINGKTVILAGSGVNLEEFRPLPYPLEDPVVFLFIGRMLREKGIVELIKAAKILKEKGYIFTVNLAGYYDDSLRLEVEAAQDHKIVKYVGFCNDIASQVRDSHCIVLPSYKEGMSNALLEAAAMARPLIACNVSGCREIVEHGKNGLLCQPKDAEALSMAMEEFINLKTEERTKMGAYSREKVEREFDRNNVVHEMMHLLQQASK